MQQYDCIVIGGGAGGLTAAVYLARAGKKVCVLERDLPGGQLNIISQLENYPGFAQVTGLELAQSMTEQVKGLGAEIVTADVVRVDFTGAEKVVYTDVGEFAARGVVLATGAAAARLGIAREQELTGDGVSYCSTCDGRFYKGADVAVAGGTVKAIHDARYLSGLCNKVYVVSETALESDLATLSNVEVIENAEIVRLVGSPLSSVTVRAAAGERELAVSGVFVARGFTPFSAPFKDAVALDERGFITVDPVTMRTSAAGVYAVGDVIHKAYRQVVTAAGEGATAAHYLMKEIR